MEIQVEIINPTEAWECNPLGDEPKKKTWMATKFVTTIEWDKWQQAEQNRRVFKVVDCHIKNCYYDGNSDNCSCKVHGSIHTAEIVNEKEVIIK